MRQFIAKENDEGVRLSRLVQRVTSGLSGGAMHKAFRNRRIKVNGKRAGAEYRLQPGDVVELYLNDELFAPVQNAASTSTPKAVPFRVEWQDESLAVLYKPAGVLCHSDNTHDGDLVGSFTQMLRENGEYDAAEANGFSPALCNRLDRGTEGLVLAAKRYAALRDMNALIKAGLLHKTYLCITAGRPPEGRHEALLTRDTQSKLSKITLQAEPGAKPVATGVRVLEEKGGLCLCEVALYTGRTHQIRAHLAFLGAPVLGDKRYGRAAANRRWGLGTQALCAYQLRLDAHIPEDNTLRHLADQTFTASETALQENWDKL